ncbi:MAG: right-handed parallel beta-helix repeat-containing protein [Pontixanthobacter sp.]
MEHYADTSSARPSFKLFGMITALAVSAIPAAAVFAQDGGAFTVVETGRNFTNLQEAVNSIGDGKGTIAIADGTHRQCAVQTAGSISFMAASPGGAIFDSVTCEGKAALVLRGRESSVSGLVFKRMAVQDFNGAGIRLEKGNLTVAQSWFLDSQQGILTADDANGVIVIDKSTFSGLGTCEGGGGCAHSVYVGDYGQLRITRSRFEKGRGGHYVKARAAKVEIASSSFDDSAGVATNYMIDLPAGSTGQITNNWFVQGQNKENWSAFIAVGAESKIHPSDGLQIAGNDARLAPSVSRNTTFVADWTGEELNIGPNNLGQGLERYDRRW